MMRGVIIDKEKAFLSSDVPLPSFETDSDKLLIRVHAAAQNPKDYKAHFILMLPDCVEGSDASGVVEKVGRKAEEFGFKVGDRVGAFLPRGGFAEYAVAHAHTTFRIPDSLGFEEAATLPLGYITAALGFFKWLPHPYPPHLPSLPPVFSSLTPPASSSPSSSPSPSPSSPLFPSPSPSSSRTTVIIYGASTSCGLYAVQLARLANLRVIAIAGNSLAQVIPLLGSDDVGIDYRAPDWEGKVRQASRGEALLYAYDYFCSDESARSLAKLLSPGGTVQIVFPVNVAKISVPNGVTISDCLTAHSVFGDAIKFPGLGIEYPPDLVSRDFGARWFHYLEHWLAQGKITTNKVTLLGGLESVPEGIKKMLKGEVSGEKFVYRV